MVNIYGRDYRKADLLTRAGDMDQLGGVRLLELSEGTERGVRAAIVRTGELNFITAIDRGMDIVHADYKGIPLGWISPTGIATPGTFEPEGFGWLRGFQGGLVTTCGLTYMGAPTVDVGEPLGLHGRISYVPARLTHAGSYWDGDEYFTVLEGEIREAKVFEPNVTLRRHIETRLGQKKIIVHDKVTNDGWIRQPLMLLYHINIGFPIVDRGSKLVSTSRFYVPRDIEALDGAENFNEFHEPVSGYKEKVYFHDMNTDRDGQVYSAIVNDKLFHGLAVYVKYPKLEMPRFTEWKMLGQGTYVVGMEPANSLVIGRDKERNWGTLQYINPQESKDFHLEIGVLEGDEIGDLINTITSITAGSSPKMISYVNDFINLIRTDK